MASVLVLAVVRRGRCAPLARPDQSEMADSGRRKESLRYSWTLYPISTVETRTTGHRRHLRPDESLIRPSYYRTTALHRSAHQRRIYSIDRSRRQQLRPPTTLSTRLRSPRLGDLCPNRHLGPTGPHHLPISHPPAHSRRSHPMNDPNMVRPHRSTAETRWRQAAPTAMAPVSSSTRSGASW